MAWAIITIYISKCAQMNPQQLPKTSKFYSRCKKCDIEKTLGCGYHPLGSPKVNSTYNNNYYIQLSGMILTPRSSNPSSCKRQGHARLLDIVCILALESFVGVGLYTA